jgi:DnaJ-class molecular chaperone
MFRLCEGCNGSGRIGSVPGAFSSALGEICNTCGGLGVLEFDRHGNPVVARQERVVSTTPSSPVKRDMVEPSEPV